MVKIETGIKKNKEFPLLGYFMYYLRTYTFIIWFYDKIAFIKLHLK